MSKEAKPQLAPYGLLSPAVRVEDLDEREVNQVDHNIYCGVGIDGAIACLTGDNVAIEVGSNGLYDSFQPVSALISAKCSTMGATIEDVHETVSDQLLIQLEKVIGKELWSGNVAKAFGSSNRYLTDANAHVVTTAAVSPEIALGLVEQAMAEDGTGAMGIIHVPKLLVSSLPIKDVNKDGILWTKAGNMVVTSSGYGVNGPESAGATDASSWIFGTGLVTVRLGEAVFYADSASKLVNTKNNTIELVGEQPFAVTWNDCVQVAAQVNIDGRIN